MPENGINRMKGEFVVRSRVVNICIVNTPISEWQCQSYNDEKCRNKAKNVGAIYFIGGNGVNGLPESGPAGVQRS